MRFSRSGAPSPSSDTPGPVRRLAPGSSQTTRQKGKLMGTVTNIRPLRSPTLFDQDRAMLAAVMPLGEWGQIIAHLEESSRHDLVELGYRLRDVLARCNHPSIVIPDECPPRGMVRP